MFGHWMVVASQKNTKIFTEVDARYRLKLIEEFDSPLGRVRNHELIRRQAGRGMKSMGRVGAIGTTKTKRSDPHEVAAQQFAKEIIDYLNKEYDKKSFESLTVVAEPNFLGILKSIMKPKIEGRVKKWIKKDLIKTPKLKLESMLLAKKPRGEK